MRAAVLAAVAVLPLLGCTPPTSSPATPSVKADEKPLPTRDELRKQLMGKTADEVIALMGKPASTRDKSDGKTDYWTYEKRSTDSVAGVTDDFAFVYFTDGTVSAVNFK